MNRKHWMNELVCKVCGRKGIWYWCVDDSGHIVNMMVGFEEDFESPVRSVHAKKVNPPYLLPGCPCGSSKVIIERMIEMVRQKDPTKAHPHSNGKGEHKRTGRAKR